MQRMLQQHEDVFYYITLMNENYAHPAMPAGVEEGITKGMYLLREADQTARAGQLAPRVQLLGSGTILLEVMAAAELLSTDFGVAADIWSVPSFTELRRDGLDVDRWNLLHPTDPQRTSFVETCLGQRQGPVVAATDHLKSLADGIRAYVSRRYRVLGTDGFGRSDYRRKLRSFFEVDRYFVTIAALKALAEEGTLPASTVADAMR